MSLGNLGTQRLPPGGSPGQYIKKDPLNKPAWTDPNDAALAHQASHRVGGADALPGASTSVPGLIELATQAEVNAGVVVDKALTPETFKTALELGQIITTTLAVDGGFAGTDFGSTEPINGGSANG